MSVTVSGNYVYGITKNGDDVMKKEGFRNNSLDKVIKRPIKIKIPPKNIAERIPDRAIEKLKKK